MIRILELTLDVNDVPVKMTANDAKQLRDYLTDLFGPKDWSFWTGTDNGYTPWTDGITWMTDESITGVNEQ